MDLYEDENAISSLALDCSVLAIAKQKAPAAATPMSVPKKAFDGNSLASPMGSVLARRMLLDGASDADLIVLDAREATSIAVSTRDFARDALDVMEAISAASPSSATRFCHDSTRLSSRADGSTAGGSLVASVGSVQMNSTTLPSRSSTAALKAEHSPFRKLGAPLG